MKRIMTFIYLTLAMLAFSAPLAFADDTLDKAIIKTEGDSGASGLYAEIPDKDFPVPMFDGSPMPYSSVVLPEEGYEGLSYVYTVADSSFMDSYKEQLRKADFVDHGTVMSVQSLWTYERKSDGLTLIVEMGQDNSSFSITMYVNNLSD